MHDNGIWRRRILGLAGAALVALAPAAAAAEPAHDFQAWLDGFRSYALEQGLEPATLDRSLDGLTPDPRVVELDRRQPELVSTFGRYLERRVTEERIATGREMLRRHAGLLARVERETGVPARYLVAFWGLETNYGGYTGDYPVLRSLATLAHDGRREALFTDQLLDALRLIERGDVAPERMIGSWAGAMGQVQFMPSVYLRHAVDGDGDGRRDLWRSLPDAFLSAGHFLSELGWKRGERWGREVRLPEDFAYALAELDVRKSLAEWRDLGIRRVDGGPLPVVADIEATLLVPQGHRGPAFLIYDNFRTIMRWNYSTHYALSVGLLADRLAGAPPLTVAPPAVDRPLRLEDVVEMQTLLTSSGFDAGAPDGLVGPATRSALRRFQLRLGVPADGFPTRDLLAALRRYSAGAG